LNKRIIYNPKTMDGFTNTLTNQIVTKAPFVKCSEKGVMFKY
jgi:hypothetical protein